MKQIIQSINEIGFLNSINFSGPTIEKQVPPEMIVQRLRERKLAPPPLIEAIMNIDGEVEQKKAAGRLLRIVIYAKSISPKGKVLKWFDTAKVTDTATNTRFKVSALPRVAESFNKTVAKKNKITKDLEQKYSAANKRQKNRLEKAEIKADLYDGQSKERLQDFLDLLDVVYLSLASERK